jgi:hypothetical protein
MGAKNTHPISVPYGELCNSHASVAAGQSHDCLSYEQVGGSFGCRPLAQSDFDTYKLPERKQFRGCHLGDDPVTQFENVLAQSLSLYSGTRSDADNLDAAPVQIGDFVDTPTNAGIVLARTQLRQKGRFVVGAASRKIPAVGQQERP